MTSRFAGIVPVLAVPFTADDAVDLDGFRAVAAHVLATGVSAVTLFGLASEFHKLGDDERVQLRRVLLELTRDRPEITAIVSITEHATARAVAVARAAVDDGADALNVLPPHFLGPSARAVEHHLDAILDAVDVPVVVQYAPAQTGTALAPDTMRRLRARHPNLGAIKVETQPPGRYVELMVGGEPAIDCMVGYAGVQMPDALRRGAVGIQPGCSFTELYVELWARHAAGDLEGFHALHRAMLPWITYWMQHVELIIQAEKTILAARGLIATERCRAPGWDLDAEERRMIDAFLEQFEPWLAPA
ncbi:MAG: dihydrodipicolinate synthase family protein [Nitriliruptoraceae bacterium]|nr:dihydrodipicolinate synthase family protein [Nitriliruptoraceae bacterium]